jgi:hypothetical protein
MRAVIPLPESCQFCCKDNKCGTESECLYQKLFVCVSICTIGCLVIIIAIRMLIGCKQESIFSIHSFENYSNKVTNYFLSKQEFCNSAIVVAHKVIRRPDYTTAFFPRDLYSARFLFSPRKENSPDLSKHTYNQRSVFSNVVRKHLKISFEDSDFLSFKKESSNYDLESSKSC